MICRLCQFETPRLQINEWHRCSLDLGIDLAQTLASMMTATVTRSLPDEMSGAWTRSRALQWIADRDSEGATLLVLERSTNTPVGLVILFEASDGVVRLGYLLVESAHGRGLASELVSGFVGWCRPQPTISIVVAGVEADNPASRRVLQKAGFSSAESTSETELLVLELRATPHSE